MEKSKNWCVGGYRFGFVCSKDADLHCKFRKKDLKQSFYCDCEYQEMCYNGEAQHDWLINNKESQLDDIKIYLCTEEEPGKMKQFPIKKALEVLEERKYGYMLQSDGDSHLISELIEVCAKLVNLIKGE